MGSCVSCKKSWPVPAVPRFCLYCGVKQPEMSLFQKKMTEVEAEAEFTEILKMPIIEVKMGAIKCSVENHQMKARFVKDLELEGVVFCPQCGEKLPKV